MEATRALEKRLDGSGRAVQKQNVDRKATLPTALEDALDGEDAAPKPYDPELLRDLDGDGSTDLRRHLSTGRRLR